MILSIDSFSDILGISLIEDDSVLIRESLYKLKPFSELLVDRLDKIFKEFNFSKKDISKIVVNKGPGSFTSLRVGITVAKTISYVLKIPVYSYISLDAMAFKYRCFTGNIVSLINAGKGEAYFREYKSDGENIFPVSDITLVKQKSIAIDKEKLYVVKNIKFTEKNIVSINEDLSVCGVKIALKNQVEDVMFLEPVYIRSL